MLFCNKRPRSRRGAALLTSAALSLLTLACDPAGEVGLDALTGEPPAAGTYTELTAHVATVRRDDSVLTANKNNVLTGELRDVTVGTTHAEAFFQVRPFTANLAAPLPVSPENRPDSLVLTLSFSQFYGTADGRQRLEAYELTDGFADDKAYYGESTLATGTKLGETPFKLRYARVAPETPRVLQHPWIVGDSTTKPADSLRVLQPVRIRVTGDLAQRLFDKLGQPELASLPSFLPVLKGIAIKPAAGSTGAIVNIDPGANATRLILYYHRDGDSAKQAPHTHIFSLGNPDAERYFSRITTTYDGEYLAGFAAPQPRAAADTISAGTTNGFTAYLQGGLELGTRVRIDGLAALRARSNGLAVNRAELFIPVKPYGAGVYPVPGQAYLVEVDSRNNLILDSGQPRVVQANGGDPNGSGNPAVVTYDASQRAYRVLLTTWLTAHLNGKLRDQRGDAFWLVPTLAASSGLSLNRALLDGAAGQVKLKLYYSELK